MSGRLIGKQEKWMINKCYFCKAEIVKERITIDFRWGDTLVVIKGIPAGICQQCGEKYLSSNVYKDLERLAKSKDHLMDQITVDILAYEESHTA